MSERILQLEQALLAVIAAAAQQGLSSDELCARAVGGLMSNGWHWANAAHKEGATDEIENALSLLCSRRLRSASAV